MTLEELRKSLEKLRDQLTLDRTVMKMDDSANNKPKLPAVDLGELHFKNRIVELIRFQKNPETAIYELSRHYRVDRPAIRIGLPKGEKKALGCYVKRDKTIYISSIDYLYDPYVVIHEFYHHLRNVTGKHRGTERHAKEFAVSFLESAVFVGSL